MLLLKRNYCLHCHWNNVAAFCRNKCNVNTAMIGRSRIVFATYKMQYLCSHDYVFWNHAEVFLLSRKYLFNRSFRQFCGAFASRLHSSGPEDSQWMLYVAKRFYYVLSKTKTSYTDVMSQFFFSVVSNQSTWVLYELMCWLSLVVRCPPARKSLSWIQSTVD